MDGELASARPGHRGIQILQALAEELAARPAVQRGMAVGADLSEDPAKLPPEEQERRAKMLYNQRARPVPVA